MKQAIYLLPVQREMIKNAMKNYRKGLTGIGQKMFDISYNKIMQMNRTVELDGMEMIYISQALNKHGKQLSAVGKFYESEHYRIIAMEVERIRITFQYQYGPKVQKEKAASAKTLTA